MRDEKRKSLDFYNKKNHQLTTNCPVRSVSRDFYIPDRSNRVYCVNMSVVLWCKGSKFYRNAQMKVLDLVKISSESMKMLHENGISVEDYKHLPMLEEYRQMKSIGDKTTYIVSALSDRYGISERKIYKLLHVFMKDC